MSGGRSEAEVLKTCVIAWCKGSLRGSELVAELKMAGFHGCLVMQIAGAVYLLMFTNEEDKQVVLARLDLTQWFTKVKGSTLGVQVGSRSAWLLVVGIPMHLWSKETFRRIAQLWGRLIRVEDATTEPRGFERARFLIETTSLDRIDETLELALGAWSGRIRIQEVEVVRSHDLVCHCKDSDTLVSSEDKQGDLDKFQMLRDNPIYAPVVASSPADIDRVAAWDEWVGVVDRYEGSKSEHMDVMRCLLLGHDTQKQGAAE
ncbi:hypothetical protein V6N13_047636 [Hibiscus sabdariffa]